MSAHCSRCHGTGDLGPGYCGYGDLGAGYCLCAAGMALARASWLADGPGLGAVGPERASPAEQRIRLQSLVRAACAAAKRQGEAVQAQRMYLLLNEQVRDANERAAQAYAAVLLAIEGLS